jgi:hypothetical protein
LVAVVAMERNPNPQFSKAHLTNFNPNNCKMIEAMGLKVLHRGPLEWYCLLPNFMKIYQAVQKLLVGDTDGLVIS